MSSAVKILPNYTYEDYLRWEGRWEVIDGIAYDMGPIASPKHQKIAVKLSIILQNALDKNDCGSQVYQPIDLLITENTIVNPDLLIVCEEISGQYYDKPPFLISEILSPSSRMKDTITKFDLYSKFGVKYYLIVDPDAESITMNELVNGNYVVVDQPYELTMNEKCRINPDFSQLFY